VRAGFSSHDVWSMTPRRIAAHLALEHDEQKSEYRRAINAARIAYHADRKGYESAMRDL
jgi:hypothetical protein